ncbi:Spc98 family protein [Myxozyma melibiosi]|uniref:Spindle pole body component n=1 Tax=Myxozyma melibiosi TaxID=54550 RepID=A0ABR1F6K7_9ASCO
MATQAFENGTLHRRTESREILSQSDRVNTTSHQHTHAHARRSRSLKVPGDVIAEAKTTGDRERLSGRSSSTRHRSPTRSESQATAERPTEKDIPEHVIPESRSVSSNSASHGAVSSASSKAVWNPEVKLIESTLSSLASRIQPPPLSAHTSGFKKALDISKLPAEVQHAVIMDDLLYVLVGTEGQYIRFHERYNPAIEVERLAGPEFRLTKGLDPSLRDITKNLLKMATYHLSVEAFVEQQSKPEYGTVNHALCAAMRTIVKEYLALISAMEYRMLTDPSFTLTVFSLETMTMAKKLMELNFLIVKLSNKEVAQPEDAEDSSSDFDKIMETLRANDGNINALNGIGASTTTSSINKGADVIKILTDRLYAVAGDPPARELLTFLLRESSKPYVKMLNLWLHRGIISDPFGEFLVKEQKGIRREKIDQDYTDEYWEKRYLIRKEALPSQIADTRTCEKILLAGKFLNVVRECGGVDASSETTDAPETIDDSRLLANIDVAYAHANSYLLSLLINTHGLAERLTSLKHYFFLDQADFFTSFVEVASHELKKPAKFVSTSKLQSLLDLTLRQPGSITAVDPFKEDLSVELNEVGLTEWLMRIVSVSGLDHTDSSAIKQLSFVPTDDRANEKDNKKTYLGVQALQFDFKIPFPLSLVISRKTILRYQLLFRHLVALKHIEQLLGSSWKDQAKSIGWTKRTANKKLHTYKARASNLRAKMLVFIQQVLYFSTSEVMEPNWVSLMNSIGSIETVDALMQRHVDFLDTCLKECMLTNAKLLKIMGKLTATCRMFSSYVNGLSRTLQSVEAKLSENDEDESIVKLQTLLDQYEQNFDHHLKMLMDGLNYYAATETVVLLSLCARLEVCINS